MPELPSSGLRIFSPPVATKVVGGMVGDMLVGPNQGGMTCHQYVELTSERPAYTSDEIARMANYLSAPARFPLPRDLLKLTQAVPVDVQAHRTTYGTCQVQLTVTNTGSEAVEITQAGLRITRAPEVNVQRYHVVDACSIEKVPSCAGQIGAGPNGCDVYYVLLTLGAAAAGATVTDTPIAVDENLNPCPPITLQSQQSIEIQLTISGSEGLVYNSQPVLLVQAGTAAGAVDAPQYAAALPFASPQEFTCYQLAGNRMTPRWTGVEALRPPDGTAWCM